MVCHLDGAKPLSEPMLEFCKLDPCEQTSVKSKFIYFQENAFEIVVCETAAILSRPQCVNSHRQGNAAMTCLSGIRTHSSKAELVEN